MVAAFAGVVDSTFLPMLDFAAKWSGHLPLPLLQESAAAALPEAFNVLLQISAIRVNAGHEMISSEAILSSWRRKKNRRSTGLPGKSPTRWQVMTVLPSISSSATGSHV